jgi:CheY-like chemotaxis protein
MFDMTQSESPAAGVNQTPEGGSSGDTPSSTDTRRVILVVDSDQLTRLLFRFRLQETGFTVHSAKNGKDAIAKLRQIRPDAVLLDLFLRDKSAIDLLREIRTQPDTRDVPVFALVPKQLTRVERKAAKWTLSKVFEKPYTRSKDIARAFMEFFDRHSRSAAPSEDTTKKPEREIDADNRPPARASSTAAVHGFTQGIESQIAATRQELQLVAERATLVEQRDAFSRITKSVETLTSAAKDENLVALGLQSAAIGGLTAALASNPADNNATVRSTLAQGVDLLYALSN